MTCTRGLMAETNGRWMSSPENEEQNWADASWGTGERIPAQNG